jgi:hypothetical protein
MRVILKVQKEKLLTHNSIASKISARNKRERRLFSDKFRENPWPSEMCYIKI